MIEWKHSNPDTVNKVFDELNHKTVLTIAIKIAARAKALAPVAKGRLRNSLMWRVGHEEGGFNDSSGETANKQITVHPTKDSEGYVGSNLSYAIYQEFGTRKMAPQPFFRPAVALVMTEQTKAEIKKMIDDEHILGKLEEGKIRESFY
jgi:HK97 gp10 family phage protein